jgi:hypothetical protein
MTAAAGDGRRVEVVRPERTEPRKIVVASVVLPVLAALAIRVVGGSPVLVGGALHAPLLDENGYRRALALLPFLGGHAPLAGSLATLAAGLLAVALAATLGRRLASPLWAGLAAIQLAWLPLGIEQSRLGRLDPQALEPAIALGVALLVLGPPRRWRFVAATALLAVAALLLPAPQLLCVGLGAGAALHSALALRDRGRTLRWTAATTLVLVLAWLWRGPGLLDVLTPPRLLWSSLPLEERALLDLLPESAVALLGYLPIAAPLLFLLALSAPPRGLSSRHGDRQLLAAWSGAFVLAGVFQLRFLVTGLALAAPLVALGLSELARRCDQAAERRARPALRCALTVGIAVGALTLLWPVFDYLDGGRPRIDQDRPRALAEAALFLRTRGHQAGQVLVLTPGGQLAFQLAGIPVTAAPWLAERGAWSARDREVCAMLVSELDEDSEALAGRLGLEWLAFQELPSASTRLILDTLGLPIDGATHAYRHRRMLGGRLMADSGSGRRFTSLPLTAVSWLQHRWESRPVYGQPQLQLFHRVRGARIAGRAQSGALVRLRLYLLSNRGRPFRFDDYRRTDREGGFAFRLPYPTAHTLSTEVVRHLAEQEKLRHQIGIGAPFEPLRPLRLPHTIALGPVRLSARGFRAEVHASEADVELGREVPIEELR